MRSSKFILAGCAVSFLFGLVACETDKRRKKRFEVKMRQDAAQVDREYDDSDEDIVISGPGGGNGGDGNSQPVIDPALIGRWVGECFDRYGYQDGQRILVGSGEASVTFKEDGTLEAAVKQYSDFDCAEDEIERDLAFVSLYSANEGKIDMVLKELNAAVFSEDDISKLNEQNQCGWNDWEVGGFKTVTKRDCSRFPARGSKGYDIYQVDGDTLAFGMSLVDDQRSKDDADAPGRKPETRPTAISDYMLTKE